MDGKSFALNLLETMLLKFLFAFFFFFFRYAFLPFLVPSSPVPFTSSGGLRTSLK